MIVFISVFISLFAIIRLGYADNMSISDINEDFTALKISKLGFSSIHSKKLLMSLMNNPQTILENYLYKVFESSDNEEIKLVVNQDNITDPTYFANSDITFLYINKLSYLDENKILANLNLALESLLGSTTKKSLVILFAVTTPDSTAKIEKLSNWIEDAYSTFSIKNSIALQNIASEDISSTVDLSIVAVSPHNSVVGQQATSLFNKIVSRLQPEARAISALYPFETVTTDVEESPVIEDTSVEGVDSLTSGVIEVLTLARNAIADSLQRLQKPEDETSKVFAFTNFVDNLLSKSTQDLRSYAKRMGVTNEVIIHTSEVDARRKIFAMLFPVFRRHVQILKQDTIKKFNVEVGEDLEITVKIMSDLKAAKNKSLKSYKSCLSKLTPRGAPPSWNTAFDVQQLEESLDEYLQSREEALKIIGVLPRGRRPIDFSIHYFLAHPLGIRDYRQDPVGYRTNSKGEPLDKPFYDPEQAKAKDISVNPKVARAMLESAFKTSGQNRIGKFSKHDSEFAREMLMFPLSIKNPGVSLVSSRSKRKTAPPMKNIHRDVEGPERFIRWDMQPLDEVKANLEKINSDLDTQSQPDVRLMDKLWNIVPAFKRSFYIEPPVKYGKRYAPSNYP